MPTLQQRLKLLSPTKRRYILRRFNDILDHELNPPQFCTYSYREPNELRWECTLKYGHPGDHELGLA